ncbi:MAG: hypothetical protein HZC54_20635 [Verrucomicrobia bacterium]|nr:hypothetical protein [Verrucomicrobiota bacterium]
MIRPAVIATAIFLALPAWAQVNVRLDLERERYLLYEPMVATVDVHNYSAGQIQLADQESTPWLRFEITRSTGERIGMVGPGFLAGTMTLGPGQAGAKAANLVAYYQIRAPGKYRVRALVRAGNLGGSFASRECTVDVVAGRQMLSKPAGFKDESGKEGLRNYSLIEVLLGRQVWLYARVEDQSGDNIYGVIPLGEWVTFSAPAAETDKEGNFHVLQQAQPRQFVHSVVSPKGVVLRRESLSNYNSIPELKRLADGAVRVVGGESLSRRAPRPPAANTP